MSFITLNNSCQKESETIQKISVDELAAVIGDIQLLDVRTKDEYLLGHIIGAINVDFLKSDFEKNVNYLDKSKPIYVYCAVGGRSSKAAYLLKQKGFIYVYDLEGGFNKWRLEKKEIKY